MVSKVTYPTSIVYMTKYVQGFCVDILYRVSQDEGYILGGHNIGHSKRIYIYTCVLLRTVSEIELFHCTVLYCTLYRRVTRHALTRSAKCIDVDDGIFENVLY
jgi:hypothetical protein